MLNMRRSIRYVFSYLFLFSIFTLQKQAQEQDAKSTSTARRILFSDGTEAQTPEPLSTPCKVLLGNDGDGRAEDFSDPGPNSRRQRVASCGDEQRLGRPADRALLFNRVRSFLSFIKISITLFR